MHETRRKVRPGLDFDERLRKPHAGQPLRNVLGQGLGAGGPGICFQRGERDRVVVHPNRAILAGQKLLDLGHRVREFGFAFRET